MFIRDTLSGVALPLRHAKPDPPEFLIFQVSREECFRKEVEETNLCKESPYKPEVQSAVTAQVMCKRQLAKHYHDQSAKQLPKLDSQSKSRHNLNNPAAIGSLELS